MVVAPDARRLTDGCVIPQRRAASFCVMPAELTKATTATQSIRVCIFVVYTFSDMFSKHLCYKAHMSLRDTLLLNIQHHMKRRSINNMIELARLSGVPQSVLSRFETGKHESISLPHIEKIAKAMHLDVAQLFLTQLTTIPIHRTEAFIGVMEQLTPQEQSVVLATGTALVESRKKSS